MIDNKGEVSFPDWLKMSRRDAGLTVKELCSLANISRQSYYYYLKSKYHPEESIFLRLKKVLEERNQITSYTDSYHAFKRVSDKRGWKLGRSRGKK